MHVQNTSLLSVIQLLPTLLMKGLLNVKHLLKCRQWCCCHCSVSLWESSSEIQSRWKRREISFGVRWCSSPACCMSSQVFTPSLSHLALSGFPGGTEPCPVWGEQTLVPATGTAEDPGPCQNCSSKPATDRPQRPNFSPFHFKCKESSVPSHELSTANTQPCWSLPCPVPSITQLQLYMQLHSKSRLRNWSGLKKEATPCKWTLKFSSRICSKALLDWGWRAGSEMSPGMDHPP